MLFELFDTTSNCLANEDGLLYDGGIRKKNPSLMDLSEAIFERL
jgi:hypothetical protein